MCGHFGMMGPGTNNQDLSFIKNLAYVSGLRGLDGTGLCQGFSSYKRKTYLVEKTSSEVSYFLWHHEWSKDGNKKVLDSLFDNFFIGHVRAATIGSIIDENAHPFEFSNFIGAHNGTLADEKYKDKSKTDSELMFKEMNENGIIPTLAELDPKSAYAIVLFDKNSGEINFVRNEKRDLVFALNRERRVLYWASEASMIHLCAMRNGIKLEKLFHFLPNVLYSIHPTNIKKGSVNWRKEKLPERQKEKEISEIPESLRAPVDRLGIGFTREDNVIPFNQPYTIPSKNKRQFRIPCSICDSEMTLVDQYFSRKSGDGKGMVCLKCDEDIENMKAKNN